LQDLKEAIKNKWKEITIETVREFIAQWKKQLNAAKSRIEEQFSTFSSNRCDWILISRSETRVELIGNFVRFGHSILCCVLYCQKTKAYNVIISHTV